MLKKDYLDCSKSIVHDPGQINGVGYPIPGDCFTDVIFPGFGKRAVKPAGGITFAGEWPGKQDDIATPRR